MGESDWLLWVVLTVANMPLYVLLGVVLYGGWENYKALLWALRDTTGFGEWMLPWERWEREYEMWTEHTRDVLRLLLYVVCCILLVVGEYLVIRWLWPRPSPWDVLRSR